MGRGGGKDWKGKKIDGRGREGRIGKERMRIDGKEEKVGKERERRVGKEERRKRV